MIWTEHKLQKQAQTHKYRNKIFLKRQIFDIHEDKT